MEEYTDEQGRKWHPYGVEFDSPEGSFGVDLWAVSYDHAELQLQALKENGRIIGKRVETVDVR